jgi:hypothetical protein
MQLGEPYNFPESISAKFDTFSVYCYGQLKTFLLAKKSCYICKPILKGKTDDSERTGKRHDRAPGCAEEASLTTM